MNVRHRGGPEIVATSVPDGPRNVQESGLRPRSCKDPRTLIKKQNKTQNLLLS